MYRIVWFHSSRPHSFNPFRQIKSTGLKINTQNHVILTVIRNGFELAVMHLSWRKSGRLTAGSHIKYWRKKVLSKDAVQEPISAGRDRDKKEKTDAFACPEMQITRTAWVLRKKIHQCKHVSDRIFWAPVLRDDGWEEPTGVSGLPAGGGGGGGLMNLPLVAWCGRRHFAFQNPTEQMMTMMMSLL